MKASEREIEVMSRQRVRVGLLMVAGFLILLAGIAGNDYVVQAGGVGSPQRVAMLVVMAGGAVLLLGNMVRLIRITGRSMTDPALRQELWDELATSNHVRSMTFAYLAILLVLVVLAVISMFTTLSSPWVVNGVMLTGLCVQAVSFALLERRGDARD